MITKQPGKILKRFWENKMKRIQDFAAARRVAAWVIFKGDKHVGTVRMHYGQSGVAHVEVLDHYADNKLYQARADGYGYDKLAKYLSGMVIDGVTLRDHWEVPGVLAGLEQLRDLGYQVIQAI